MDIGRDDNPLATRTVLRPAVAVVAGIFLTGCAGPLSSLDPAGPAAATIARLWWVMLAGSLVLLCLVLALLALAFVTPEAGRKVAPSVWLVGGGLVLPAVVLTPLMIYALWGGGRLLAAAGSEPVDISVVGRQWEWRFIYRTGDGRAVRSDNVLHMPANRPVRLGITSEDVIHSFWVPRLGGKIDAIPGHVTTLVLSSQSPGTYHGVCAEFCGRDHAAMHMTVRVHASPLMFDEAVNALPARSPDD